MVQKTLSVPEGVYRKLKAKKGDDETFSDVILRLLQESDGQVEKPPIESFFGTLDDEGDEWEGIEQRLYEARDLPRDRRVPR